MGKQTRRETVRNWHTNVNLPPDGMTPNMVAANNAFVKPHEVQQPGTWPPRQGKMPGATSMNIHFGWGHILPQKCQKVSLSKMCMCTI
jgi:hypothetical protein